MSDQVNYLALALAVIASMAIGAIWYSTLEKLWLRATGLTKERIEEEGGAIGYMIAFLSHALMAYVLIGVIYHSGKVTVMNGLMSALFIWGGFVLTSMAVTHRFQLRPWSLTLIDAGHYLLIMLAQGAILGWFGVNPT